MRARALSITCLSLSTLLVATACGGSQPQAEAPESPAPETASGGESEAAAEGSGENADEAEAGGGAAEKDAKEEPKPTRSAKDIVSRPDVLFMPSLQASEPYQKAEKACVEKAKDDPKKKADCMAKATKDMDADGIAFQQDKEGKLWWLTIRRKGSNLVTLHKIEFEWGEDGEKEVTIKPRGPDKGSKPRGNIPRELKIEVPSDSEIAIDDPKQGRLVYEAKLGLLGEQQR